MAEIQLAGREGGTATGERWRTYIGLFVQSVFRSALDVLDNRATLLTGELFSRENDIGTAVPH